MRTIQGIARLPLLALSLSFIIGIALGAALPLDGQTWLAIAAALLLIMLSAPRIFPWLAVHRPGVVRAVLGRLSPRLVEHLSRGLISPAQPGSPSALLLVFLCLLGLSLGALRYQSARLDPGPQDLAWYNDQSEPLEVIGVIVRPPDVRDTHVQAVIAVEQINAAGAEPVPAAGKLLAYLPTTETWAYGDRVRVWGQLNTPPVDQEFSYRDYLARKGIYSYMPYTAADRLEGGQASPILGALYAFKQRGLERIYTYLPDPEASLVAGIVLGVESGIPDDVDQAFKDTGTTHVIAISGFNITIVSSLFAMLFGRMLGPRRGAVAALLAISLYTVLVGGDAAVVRAAIMGGLSLFARQVGRRQHGLNSLGFTAALMTGFNPQILWDIGFQLSFAATLGLVLYAQPWEEALRAWLTNRFSADAARRLTGPISEYLLLTLAAQLITFPLIVYHFGRLSLSSLPANVAILPAQPPVMNLGGLSVLLGEVWRPLGQALAYAVWPFVAYTIRVVEWFAGWDAGVRVIGGVDLWMVVDFYLFLFAATLFWQPLTEKLKLGFRPALALGVLFVITILIWQAAVSRPDGRLHLSILDVGDGEAILIETPDVRFVLVNGGESATQLSEGLGRSLPLFHRKLDMLVVAGTRADQLNALPSLLPRYAPAQVWWAGDLGGSAASGQAYAWADQHNVPLVQILTGQSIDLGRGAQLQALAVSEEGAVLLVSWGGFRCLLPVGAGKDQLSSPDVLVFSREVSALMLARSGDLDYNPPEWLAAAQPKVVVVSVSAYNRGSLPDAALLESLNGYPILRTDLNGSIELGTEGVQMWVYAEKH